MDWKFLIWNWDEDYTNLNPLKKPNLLTKNNIFVIHAHRITYYSLNLVFV